MTSAQIRSRYYKTDFGSSDRIARLTAYDLIFKLVDKGASNRQVLPPKHL